MVMSVLGGGGEGGKQRWCASWWLGGVVLLVCLVCPFCRRSVASAAHPRLGGAVRLLLQSLAAHLLFAGCCPHFLFLGLAVHADSSQLLRGFFRWLASAPSLRHELLTVSVWRPRVSSAR